MPRRNALRVGISLRVQDQLAPCWRWYTPDRNFSLPTIGGRSAWEWIRRWIRSFHPLCCDLFHGHCGNQRPPHETDTPCTYRFLQTPRSTTQEALVIWRLSWFVESLRYTRGGIATAFPRSSRSCWECGTRRIGFCCVVRDLGARHT